MTDKPAIAGKVSSPRYTWRNNGAHNGLWFEVVNDEGGMIPVALQKDADDLVHRLNRLEEDAAFGQQCIQDECEGAFIHSTIHKRLQRKFDRAIDALESVMGHGYTLPLAGNYSEDFTAGYGKGVGSQRQIAKECIEDLNAWNAGEPE